MCVLKFVKENNKSEPVSHREDLVRIILVWCGRQDSNLHAFAEEPKGDVTTVKVFCSIHFFTLTKHAVVAKMVFGL